MTLQNGGGIRATDATVELIDTLIANNQAGTPGGLGGGIYLPNYDGPFANSPETELVAITNSTISGNSAYLGGGIFTDSSPVTVTATTITDNTATSAGGGVFFGAPQRCGGSGQAHHQKAAQHADHGVVSRLLTATALRIA